MTDGSNSPDSKRSVGADLFIAARSAPAQKEPPAPVRIATRTASSEFTRSQASAMISSISPDSAFRFSGRFMVTTSVWSTSSTRQCGSAPEETPEETSEEVPEEVPEEAPGGVSVMGNDASQKQERVLVSALWP